MAGARERLLLSTIDLVRERGVHGTGIAEVLERSGTARGSVYQHFPDGKGQLVAEAVKAAGRHVSRLMSHETTAAGKLDALLDWWTDAAGVASCPVAAAAVDTNPRVREAAQEVLAAWTERIASALPGDDAMRLARFTISAFEGAILQCRARGDLVALEDLRVVLRPLLRNA